MRNHIHLPRISIFFEHNGKTESSGEMKIPNTTSTFNENESFFFKALDQTITLPFEFRPLPTDPVVPSNSQEQNQLVSDSFRNTINSHLAKFNDSALIQYQTSPLEKCSFFRHSVPSSQTAHFLFGFINIGDSSSKPIQIASYFPDIHAPYNPQNQIEINSNLFYHPVSLSFEVITSKRMPTVLQSGGTSTHSRFIPHYSPKIPPYLFQFTQLSAFSSFISLLNDQSRNDENSLIVVGENAINEAISNNSISFVLDPESRKFTEFHSEYQNESLFSQSLKLHGIPSLNLDLLFQNTNFLKYPSTTYPSFKEFLQFVDTHPTSFSSSLLNYKGKLPPRLKQTFSDLDSMDLETYLKSFSIQYRDPSLDVSDVTSLYERHENIYNSLLTTLSEKEKYSPFPLLESIYKKNNESTNNINFPTSTLSFRKYPSLYQSLFSFPLQCADISSSKSDVLEEEVQQENELTLGRLDSIFNSLSGSTNTPSTHAHAHAHVHAHNQNQNHTLKKTTPKPQKPSITRDAVFGDDLPYHFQGIDSSPRGSANKDIHKGKRENLSAPIGFLKSEKTTPLFLTLVQLDSLV